MPALILLVQAALAIQRLWFAPAEAATPSRA